MSHPAGRRSLVLLLFLVLHSSVSSAQQGGRCDQSPRSYEGYTVHDVRIDTPLAWLFGSVEKKLQDILADPSMPIKKGNLYRKADSDAGFIKLTEKFPELTVSPIDRVAVRVAKPALQNCDAQARTLDVVYHVYTFGFSYYLSRAFESGRKEEVKRTVVDTQATQRLANYFPQPFVGYNRSRHLFGGTKLSIKQPGGLLNTISLDASGSSSSSEVKADAKGSHDYDKGFISHLEYQFRYLHSDIPGESVKLKEGTGLGQFFAATRARGSSELILRFGAAVEGGNKQADVSPPLVPPENLANSGYGSIKTFVGGTMRVGRHAFKGSYGIQLGSADGGSGLDYVKQVFDTAAILRFLVGAHKPVTLDIQFTAGHIDRRGRLPLAERFFGGNAERNFIASDTWTIRSNPFIRSFPENSLARTSDGGILGGDQFFSANATLAATVWSKPLVPREVLDDPDLPRIVEFQFGSAESALRNQYLSESPEFRRVAEMIRPLSAALTAVEEELTALENQNPPQEVRDQISLSRTDLTIAGEAASSIKSDLADGTPKTADIRKLVVGFPDKTPPISAYASDLVDDLTLLKDIAGVPTPNQLGPKIDELERRRQQMADAFVALDQSPAARQAEERARSEMKYPRRVFNELLHEANLIAFSPVAIFDAARLHQQEGPADRTRYAVGGGVRVGIVSLDLTAGYAWNPNRRPWEPRGAMLFTMEVSNLFR